MTGIALTVMMLVGCATRADYATMIDSVAMDRQTSDRLETFRNKAEFQSYLRQLERIHERNGTYWVGNNTPVQFATLTTDVPLGVCPEDDRDCLSEVNAQDTVVVTGSSIAPTPSITNNQMIGVDEGDIVKQIGDYLIVLQDGRLFSVKMKPDQSGELTLADRINVYRSEDADTWYDEMLVRGNQIVVTGYSYDMQASEVSIVAFDQSGQFGEVNSFYMTADDYYSSENYASRIVGDKFIVRNQVYLEDIAYEGDEFEWPVILKWSREYQEDEFESDAERKSRPLMKVRDVYKPVQPSLYPVLHSLTVCDLDEVSRDDLGCRTTAFIAGEYSEFFVSGEYAYIWSTDDQQSWTGNSTVHLRDCLEDDSDNEDNIRDALPGMLHRVRIANGRIDAAEVFGFPQNQFGMTIDSEGVFQALAYLPSKTCEYSDEGLALVRLSERRFGKKLQNAKMADYRPMPYWDEAGIKNRFLGDTLVYAESTWRRDFPEAENDANPPARTVVVSLSDKSAPVELVAPHDVIRLEAMGEEFVLTGYRDNKGLLVSNLNITGEPSFVSTIRLPDQYESEGRSHAFNYRVDEDGSALLGVPTVTAPEDNDRYWWWSAPSQIAFMARDADRQLARLGELGLPAGEEHELYECEVSCVDWYGNSRPIFTNGRVFALSGTEIVEGEITNGAIKEVGRINLTGPLNGKPREGETS